MQLSRFFQALHPWSDEQTVKQLLECNEQIKAYGLVLSSEDVQQLLQGRSEVLSHYARLELSSEVTKTLIVSFANSVFIEQETYVDTLHELHELFYALKNDTEDRISDMQIIEKMRELYEEECEGSIMLLRSKLEGYAEEVRRLLLQDDFHSEGAEDGWN